MARRGGNLAGAMVMALLVVWASGTLAQNAPPAVPPALAPWVDWVLHDHPEHDCPLISADPGRHCAWPGPLAVTVDAEGARFTQSWQLFAPGWVPLPGDSDHWPTVSVDGEPVAVTGARPRIWLPAGRHRLSGELRWSQRPAALPVPEAIGLIQLTLDGNAIVNPRRDGEALWLGNQQRATAADGLELKVYRQLRDGVPVTLETRLQLAVSGQDRELTLGRLLPEGFAGVHLDSELPARLEDDGRLRVQVRQGTFSLRFYARKLPGTTAMGFTPLEKHWPQQELWAFKADPDLRAVRVTGAPVIDPAQTESPWRDLPTYLLSPDSRLVLETISRGLEGARPLPLQLQRTLWLDFDGGGWTARDQLRGSQRQAQWLSLPAPFTLGRAERQGQPQVISQWPATGEESAEMESAELESPEMESVDLESADSNNTVVRGLFVPGQEVNLTTLARLDATRALPISGWDAGFDRVTTTVQLPPGWRLLAVAGADQVRGSWLEQWRLWDLFLVALIALASARLLGWPWGLVAAGAMALAYHLPAAPVASVLNALVAVALVAGSGARWRAWARRYWLVSLLLLALVLVPFSYQQIRNAFYPQLAGPLSAPHSQQAGQAPYARENATAVGQMMDEAVVMAKQSTDAAPAAALPTDYDPERKAQTGPGEPNWQWRQATLSWQGPIQPSDQWSLWLIPPWLTALLQGLSVALLVALLARLANEGAHPGDGQAQGTAWSRLRGWLGRAPTASAVLVLALMLGMSVPGAKALAQVQTQTQTPAQTQNTPPPAMLEELRQRLTAAPVCAPHCLSYQAVTVRLTEDELALFIEADAVVAGGLPLPRLEGDRALQPRVQVNGDAAWAWQSQLLLPAGQHRLLLRYDLAGASELSLSFPQPPHRLRTQVSGWRWQGDPRGSHFQLLRQAGTDQALLQPQPMPGFARVERTLVFDREWQVVTRVTQAAPHQGNLSLSIPLLPGERVLTSGIAVVDGAVPVTLSGQRDSMRWVSRLPATTPLTLSAPADAPWVETWTLEPSAYWRLRTEGIPATLAGNEWMPRPGEQLVIHAARPAVAPGADQTLERALLKLVPGPRARDVHLELTVRASHGSDWRLPLPATATVQQVRRNGDTLPLQRDGEALVVPLQPGSNQLEIHWRAAEGMAAKLATPALDLGLQGSNARVQIDLPGDRWLLWTQGPTLGPAVLFWGIATVVALVALGLGRLPLSPLKSWQWLLLGLGLAPALSWAMVPVAAWFLALAWRERHGAQLPRWGFNTLQVGLLALTLLAGAMLAAAVPEGLLGRPQMFVAGNGSSAGWLQWYQDRIAGTLPSATVWSLPLWAYRLLMLAWALWLAFSLLAWLRWGWGAITADGFWRQPPPPPAKKPRMEMDLQLPADADSAPNKTDSDPDKTP